MRGGAGRSRGTSRGAVWGRTRHGAALLLALGVAASVLARVGPAGADTGAPPVLVDVFGGPNHAEMYPSGLEVDPDGNIVVADTGNNQVAKYAPDGTLLWRVGSWGDGVGNFDNPRDVAIDSAGDIYVVDTRNSRVVKLAPSGAWLDAYGGPPGDPINFPMGATITDDVLYLADTGRKKVRRIDVTGGWAELPPVVADPDGGRGPGSGCRDLRGIRDADADAQGNVYVAGYRTNDVLKFDATGNCVDWGGTGTGPGQFRTPYGVRVAYDPVWGQEVIHVADGLNARVQVFTLTGTYLAEYGTFGEPDAPGTVTAVRRVAVASDGDAWIADLWGNRIERYDRSGSGFAYAATIGTPLPPDDDTRVFHEPRQVAVGPDAIVNVIDTVHHRFVRFDGSGHIVGMCGDRAVEGAQLGEFNWPRGIAVDLATGEIWVADTKQNRIQVVRPDCTGLVFIGDFSGGSGPNQLSWPYGVAIRQADRIAFVTDTENHRIKSFDVATRTQLAIYGSRGSGWAQFRRPAGIAVSPVDRHIFVADSENHRIKELASPDGVIFTTVRNISKGFNHPEGVAVDAQGRIYVADSGNDRVVILDASRNEIAVITADGLRHPATVAVDAAGRLYVSDTLNDRVLVYEWPGPDTTPPEGTLTFPADNEQVVIGPMTVAGGATDNVGVTAVDVAIKSVDLGQWWNGTGWQATFRWNPASVASPGAPSTTWSYDWTPPATGGYQVTVRARDAAGNADPTRPFHRFTVVEVVDTTPPDATVSVPSNNQSFPPGPVTFQGAATDDVGVARVRIAVKNRATGEWWNGSGWSPSFRWFADAVLASPGAPATAWQYTWNPPAAGGYALMVRAEDGAGNQDPTKPYVNFSVT